MINDIEARNLVDVIYGVMRRTSRPDYMCMWLSKSMKSIIMFHVSKNDLRSKFYDWRPTYICYSDFMMYDMWDRSQYARKCIDMVNIIATPIECARTPCNGDSWCDCRGGAVLLQTDDWKFARVLHYCNKSEAAEWLTEHGYFRFDSRLISSDKMILNALLGGNRICPIGISYFANEPYINYMNYLLKIRKRVILFRKLQGVYNKLIDLNKYMCWNNPIFIGKGLVNVYVKVENDSKGSYYSIGVTSNNYHVVSADDLRAWVDSGGVVLLQSFLFDQLKSFVHDEEDIRDTKLRRRVYRSTYYDVFSGVMLDNILQSVEE